MDLKEILPFIIVIAISIIGRLTKKKSKEKGTSKKKNILETFLDELNGRNSVEVSEQEPQPVFEMAEAEGQVTEFESTVNTSDDYNDNNYNMETPQVVEKKSVSLLDQFKQSQKKKHETEKKEGTQVMDSSKNKRKHAFSIKNAAEARKAIIYAEIIKPRYF